jgi:hypothetical protein
VRRAGGRARPAGLAQVTALMHLSSAAQAAREPERWRAGALLSGAHALRSAPGLTTSDARLAVGLPHRAGLAQVTALMHLSWAAQAACQPERARGGAALGGRAHLA